MDTIFNAGQVISMADAMAQGKKRYFSDMPCKRGHIAERYVSDRSCTACTDALGKAWRTANPEKVRGMHARSAAKRHKQPGRKSKLSEQELAAKQQRDRDNQRRLEAISLGYEEYVSEIPCRHGNTGTRLVSSRACRCAECLRYKATQQAKHKNSWRKRDKTANPEKYRLINRASKLRKYGLSLVDFEEMLRHQEGVCAICKMTPEMDKAKRGFHVDHDHKTGKVRALLCSPCNLYLGHVEANPWKYSLMLDYLTTHSEKEGTTNVQ